MIIVVKAPPNWAEYARKTAVMGLRGPWAIAIKLRDSAFSPAPIQSTRIPEKRRGSSWLALAIAQHQDESAELATFLTSVSLEYFR